MRGLRLGVGVLLLAVCLPVMAQAQTQSWPSHPIRFYCGFAPGGSSDIVSRLLAQKLTERLGQPVVVEQKVGASGLIANDAVAKASPDGYTMVLLTGGHPSAMVMMKKVPYDAVKDFAMVSTVTSYPMVIAVAQQSPYKTLADLLARGRAEPAHVTFAVSGPGSLHHLLAEWVNIEAGTTILAVPFKGASQAMIELLGGRVDAMVETATASFPQIRAGKLRALALSSSVHYPLMPEAPLISETLPGIEVSSWLGLAVAPGTPRAIVDRLNREVRAIVELPDVRQRFADLGGVPAPSSPEEMRERIERELVRWKRVVDIKQIERQ